MRSCIFSIMLLALLTATAAVAAPAGPQVAVYFDREGTVRYKDSPGVNVIDEVYIYGEGFPAAFISGIQYSVDYGPSLQWLGDNELPPVKIGSSPTGIAIGFGANPQPGNKFFIQSATVLWTTDCAAVNVDGPVVLGHPALGPVQATRFPDFDTIMGSGARSQTCQMVEIDIRAGSCPNPMNIALWDFAATGNAKKGGVIPVLLLGSASVDLNMIDISSLLLEGVPPLPTGIGMEEDDGYADGADQCVCNVMSGDGYNDLTLRFRSQDIAEAIANNYGNPNVGDELVLTLTGTYLDGMPFEGTDCVKIVGNAELKAMPWDDSDDADLSYPNPNPFNPVTRFSYTVPATQHVRLAVYDIAGRLVEELVNEVKASGRYVVEWDAVTLPSGVYFYRLEAGDKTIVRRATLLK